MLEQKVNIEVCEKLFHALCAPPLVLFAEGTHTRDITDMDCVNVVTVDIATVVIATSNSERAVSPTENEAEKTIR